MTSIDSINKVVLNINWNKTFWLLYILYEELNIWFNTLEFIFYECLLTSNHFLQSSNILLWQSQDNLCLEWDSITHITTFPRSQARTEFGNGIANEANHLLIGIGTSLIDFKTRVTTT